MNEQELSAPVRVILHSLYKQLCAAPDNYEFDPVSRGTPVRTGIDLFGHPPARR
jgi:hypothetical protein